MESYEKMVHKNFGGIETGYGDLKVEVTTLDNYAWTSKIHLIKIDAEGNEIEILKGAEELIKKWRPMIYIENDHVEKSTELISWFLDHDYRLWWHRPPLFYQGNYKGEEKNVFQTLVSINMFCAPEESGVEVFFLQEVADPRVDSKMYERELKRTLRHLERNTMDFDSRFKAAHFHNLLGQTKEARQCIALNLSLDGGNVGSLAIQGLMDLQDGNFEKGWPAYELRYKQAAAHGFGFRPHDVPHWDGTATDERVLIWCEQGFGDSIMFGRFMKNVLELAPNAILELQPQLYELFEHSKIMPEGQLFRLGRTMPDYKYHCSLPSIPATLKFTKEEQVHSKPYLFADPEMVEGWYKRSTPRIGLCTRGGAASERSYSRDMPTSDISRVTKDFGPFMSLNNDGQWESFADTATAIAAMDLVLTVDTSMAHLAGALGTPVWLMLSSDPDWRWQRTRSDSPWYPSMKIFRQKEFMNWTNVVEEIRYNLETRVENAKVVINTT